MAAMSKRTASFRHANESHVIFRLFLTFHALVPGLHGRGFKIMYFSLNGRRWGPWKAENNSGMAQNMGRLGVVGPLLSHLPRVRRSFPPDPVFPEFPSVGFPPRGRHCTPLCVW